jgi:hypothetical protein
MGAPVTLSIGGRELVVRPLTVGAFEAVAEFQRQAEKTGPDAQSSPETMKATVAVIAAALSRGNEGVTVEWLNAELELGAVRQVLAAIMSVSGLVAAPTGEAPSP